MQHTLGKCLTIVIAVGNASPEEHAHLVGIVCAAKHLHDLLGILASSSVGFYVSLSVPCLGMRMIGGYGVMRPFGMGNEP